MSKFQLKLPPKPAAIAELPVPATTREEFVAGAAMVRSQSSGRPEKPVRLNLDMDPGTHRRLKMRALQSGQTIAQMVRDLIDRELG